MKGVTCRGAGNTGGGGGGVPCLPKMGGHRGPILERSGLRSTSGARAPPLVPVHGQRAAQSRIQPRLFIVAKGKSRKKGAIREWGTPCPARTGPLEGANVPSEDRDLPYWARFRVRIANRGTDLRPIGPVPGLTSRNPSRSVVACAPGGQSPHTTSGRRRRRRRRQGKRPSIRRPQI